MKEISEKLCYEFSLYAESQLSFRKEYFHGTHDGYIQHVIENTVNVFANYSNEDRVFLIELGMNYLLTRMFHDEAFRFFLSDEIGDGSFIESPIALALSFLRKNIALPLDIDALCMSRSKLYSLFKSGLRISPEKTLMRLRLESAPYLLSI